MSQIPKNDKEVKDQTPVSEKAGLFLLLKPYTSFIVLLVVLTIIANGLNLFIPRITSQAIDSFAGGNFSLSTFITHFGLVTLGIFIFALFQSLLQVYASERIARNLRRQLIEKISKQSTSTIQNLTTEKLLTNLTSDIDVIKTFISQAISSLISSLFLIIGASILLVITNWKLALVILAIIPLISLTFFFVFKKIRHLFKDAQESIDRLNKIINESILGAALIRIVYAQGEIYEKFLQANENTKNISLSILRMFASLIPIISFFTNLAILLIVSVGGYFVINDSMTLGELAAFQSYLAILIFPILILGFVSSLIAQASASYSRIHELLTKPDSTIKGYYKGAITGDIQVDRIKIVKGENTLVEEISFDISARTKTAIIGPTAAGKTQLLYALTGLTEPTSGTISYNKVPLNDYDKEIFHNNVGFVFQDSVLFNLSLRENIAFNTSVTDESLDLAIETALLSDFIKNLPQGLDTLVSERGTTLSGGQKQRIMLARALALNPKILILDDFTARVDIHTERKILENITRNYPEITLISVTQKIASVENYDQIIVLMDGNILGKGTHAKLLQELPEYVQIYESQQSTEEYELQT